MTLYMSSHKHAHTSFVPCPESLRTFGGRNGYAEGVGLKEDQGWPKGRFEGSSSYCIDSTVQYGAREGHLSKAENRTGYLQSD